MAIAHHAPDLVLLQEVDNLALRSRRDRQVDVLGELLGFRHRAYFPNVTLRNGGEYGNAILSRFPITESRNINLTVPFKKRRSALHARVRMRLGSGRARTLHVFNLHLGLSGIERAVQIRRFLDSHPFAGLDARAPIIVGGDFNDVWGKLGRKFLVPVGFRGPSQPIRTFPAYAPLRALDSMYVRGSLQIEQLHRSHLAVARFASDHLPLAASLRILRSIP
jgi:endonuclease/exonuclease/phosphatase family metal-dependent hydrolase